jgi:hypothetical protein
MVDQEIIREWIMKAEDDFHFARISLSENKPFWAHICFQYSPVKNQTISVGCLS